MTSTIMKRLGHCAQGSPPACCGVCEAEVLCRLGRGGQRLAYEPCRRVACNNQSEPTNNPAFPRVPPL